MMTMALEASKRLANLTADVVTNLFCTEFGLFLNVCSVVDFHATGETGQISVI